MYKRLSDLSLNSKITVFGKKIAVQDILALTAFFGLFGWFIYVSRFGVNAADEGFYCNIAQRVLQGDRLLVDEWQVSQFSSFLLILPYRLYTAAVGSTEGIILYQRMLYIFVTGIVYWWLYSKYRRYGFGALAGIVLFCAFVPGDMFALFYMSMAIQGLMVICTLVFLPSEKTRSAFVWVFIGVVLTCTVLAQPPFCVLYFIYSIIVLFERIRKKNRASDLLPVFLPRSWALITIGVFIAAVPVMAYLLVKSGPKNIIRIFPELFTDAEYDFRYEHFYNVFWKFLILCRNFGYVFSAVWGLLFAGGGAVYLKRRRENKKLSTQPGNASAIKKRPVPSKKFSYVNIDYLSRIIFLLACVCLAGSYIYGVVSFAHYKNDSESHQLYMYYFYHAAPSVAFCAVCGLLLKKKEPSFIAFWFTVVIGDILMAYSSQVTCSVCGIVLFPLVFITSGQLIDEFRTEKLSSGRETFLQKSKLLYSAAAVGLCAFLCFESLGPYISRFYLPIEHYESGAVDKPLDTVLQKGPLKGLVTNRDISDIYYAFLSDLDILSGECTGRIYLAGTCPYFYLYLDKPAGTYSTWFVDDDALVRQIRYMQLLPENCPQIVYIPFFDFATYRLQDESQEPDDMLSYEEKLSWVQQYSDCTVTRGSVGYIVEIIEWRIPPTE